MLKKADRQTGYSALRPPNNFSIIPVPVFSQEPLFIAKICSALGSGVYRSLHHAWLPPAAPRMAALFSKAGWTFSVFLKWFSWRCFNLSGTSLPTWCSTSVEYEGDRDS